VKATQEHLISHVLPMLLRAYDDTDPRLQEEALRRTLPLSHQLDIKVALNIFAKVNIYHLISFSFLQVRSVFFLV
jgi:hypothetical protein